MAFTRKMLKALGIEEDKIEQIMDAHVEVVDSLKSDRDKYKEDADKLAGVQKELDDLKKDGGDWKTKYEKEHSDFVSYKTTQTEKETEQAKKSAYTELLKKAGISEKRIPAVLKVTDMKGIELDTEGNVKDADAKIESVKTEWADFITETRTDGADVKNPYQNNGGGKDLEALGKMSMADYIAARQKG